MQIAEMVRLQDDGNHVPERVTIHAMAEFIDLEPYDVPALDFLSSMGLSAHYLITPSGCVQRCLDDKRIGRHAGRGLNSGNIGIEMLVPGVHTYATFASYINDISWPEYISQWNATVGLVMELRGKYNLKDMARVVVRGDTSRKESTEPWLVRHSDIAPGRKIDPGQGFAWQAFRKEVYNL